MKSEKMYEAVSGIRDDLIEAAGEYEFKKRKRGYALIGYAAAACLVLGLGLFGLSKLIKKAPEQQAMTPEPTSAVICTEEPRIVNGRSDSIGEQVAKVGQRFIHNALQEALDDPENEGCLFDVEVWIQEFADVEDYMAAEYAAWQEKANAPAIQRYNEEYEYWLENVYEPTEADTAAQEMGKGREAEYFAEYWAENYPQELRDAYAEAVEEARAAMETERENTSREALGPIYAAAMEKTLASLKESGYELELTDRGNDVFFILHGLLTKAQIESFPVEENGAFIIFAAHEGAAIDE